MYRSIPVANKACAERVRSRAQELHVERIKNMRSSIDTTEPAVAHLDHLRNNLKREQMLEERYHNIDRENRLLLQKMSDMMKQEQKPSAKPARRTQSLTRGSRKHEAMRITRENSDILRRIREVQPVYSHVALEESYRRNFEHLKNITEYPLVLKKKSSAPGSLAGLNNAMSSSSPDFGARAGRGQNSGDELTYVLKEGKHLGKQYYLIEMATDGRTLAISAHDSEQRKTLELVVKEQNHRKLYREFHGDYSRMAERLYLENERLHIRMSEGPLGSKVAEMAATF